MNDFFKPEDFEVSGVIEASSAHAFYAADRANRKLKAHIETLPVVYGFKTPETKIWSFAEKYFENGIDTHRARLFQMEEIKPKECEHKEFVNYEFRSDKGIICTCICGAKLSPNHWKEVE